MSRAKKQDAIRMDAPATLQVRAGVKAAIKKYQARLIDRREPSMTQGVIVAVALNKFFNDPECTKLLKESGLLPD